MLEAHKMHLDYDTGSLFGTPILLAISVQKDFGHSLESQWNRDFLLHSEVTCTVYTNTISYCIVSCPLSTLNSNPKMGSCLIFRNVLSSVILLKFNDSMLGLFEHKLIYVSLQP